MTVQETRYNANREKFYILWLTHEGVYKVDTHTFTNPEAAKVHLESQLKHDVYKAGKILDQYEISL